MWVLWTFEVKQYAETLTNKQSQNGHIQLMKGNVGGGGGGLGSLNAKHVRTKVNGGRKRQKIGRKRRTC